MKKSILTFFLLASSTAFAEASCPMDFGQVPGMNKLNDMKMTSNPSKTKACNIQMGNGTGQDGSKNTIYFQNGQPCILQQSGTTPAKPVCGQELTKQIDSNDDHVTDISSAFTSQMDQQLSSANHDRHTNAELGYGKDENGKTCLFIYPIDPQTGKVDKSHYVRLLQKKGGGPGDCEMQSFGGQQVGDVVQSYTAGGGGGASCNGAISMLGDSQANFGDGGMFPVVNDTLAKVGDQNGAGKQTQWLQTNSNGGGTTSQ